MPWQIIGSSLDGERSLGIHQIGLLVWPILILWLIVKLEAQRTNFCIGGIWPAQPQLWWIGAGPVGKRKWQEVGRPAHLDQGLIRAPDQGQTSWGKELWVIGWQALPSIGVGG